MADVTVDSTGHTNTARGARVVVFVTDLIGYCFFVDSDQTFGYCKTTDGGATWGAQVNIETSGTVQSFDVWFDQWTSGDTGTKIHTWWFDTTNDDVLYRALDTNGDTLGTQRTVLTGASAVAGRGVFVSGTKTLSGYLYCAYDMDAGAEKGLHRSTDGGTTWGASLSATFVEATLDTCKLYPAHGTGDNNDCWAIYYDASATALTLKLWDSSAASATESATIQTHTDGPTDLTGQYGFDASVRWSDGHLILAAVSLRDNAASTHQVFDITSTASIATKTAITTNIDDHYYPQVYINQTNDHIYVAYNGKRDGSETMDTTTKVYYTKSTDGGTTWSAGDTAYMEGSAAVVQQVWSPLTGPRFGMVWRVASGFFFNKVNSLALTQYISGVTIASGSSASGIFGPEFVFESPATPVALGTSLFLQTSYGAGPEDEWQYDHLELYEPSLPVAAKFSDFPGGTVTQVLVTLAKHLFPGEEVTGTCTMKIRSGSYTGTILASSTTTITPATDLLEDIPRWIAFDFPATVLSAGGTYWFTLERSTTQFSNYIEWHYSDGDTVANYGGVDADGFENVDEEPALIVISATPPIAAGSSVNAPTVVADPAVTGQHILSTARIPYTETLLFEHAVTGSFRNQPYTGRAESQTVTGQAGYVTSISLLFAKIGSPTDSIYLVIRDSTFNGTILDTSVPVPCASVATYPSQTWVNFQLHHGILFSSGTTYWIEMYLTRIVYDGSNFLTNVVSLVNEYAAGEAKTTGGGAVTDADFNFRLYTGASHTVALDQVVTGTTIASGSSVTAPADVSSGQSVTGTTITTGSAVTAPTVAYTVAGTTITTGSSVNVPTLALVVTGVFIEPNLSVNVPMVTYAFTGATIAVGSAVTAPTVVPGAVTVTGTTLSSGSVVTVPTLAYGIVGANRASAVVLNAPTVIIVQAVTTGHIDPDLQDHSWSTSVDASYKVSIAGFTDDFGTWVGQEFTIPQRETLTSIALRMSRTGSPSDNLYVEINADGRDGPAIGVSSSVAASSVPLHPVSGDDSDFIVFTFPTPVTLLPGLYAWVAKRTGAGSFTDVVNIHTDLPTRISSQTVLIYHGGLSAWNTSTVWGAQYRLNFAAGVFAPTTITPGAVTVVGSTCPTTSQVFAATVAPGAVTVVGVTITTAAQVFEMTVVLAGSLAGVFVSSTSQVFVPTLVADQVVTTAFISRSYAATIIEDDPTLYWRLDETGATAVDEIAGEIGTISGGVTSIAGPLASGNAAMHFDGTGKIVPATNFRLHAGSWSVEGWFKRAAVPGGGNDFESWWSNGNFLNGNFYLGIHAGGAAQGQWIGATPTFIDSSTLNLIGAWHHMVVTYDGTWWRLYLDGVLRTNDAVTAATEPWPNPQKPGCIGWEPNRDRFWTGDIDEVAIYPYTLTDDQIAVHYAAASSLSLETQAFAPTVAPGATTVTGASIASGSAVQAPTVTVGAVTILAATRGAASLAFAPTLTPLTTGATITSTVQLIAPSVTPGAVTVVATRVVSAPQMFAPTVVPGAATVLGATLASGSQTRAPSVVMVTQGATIPTLSQVFAPVVVIEHRITTAFVTSTSVVFAATVEVEIIPILVGGIDSAAEVFPPSLIARLFPPLALAHARVGVRYLVTSADVTCMMSATSGVSVRYLGVGGVVTTPVLSATATVAVRYSAESDGVSVNVLEAT